MSFLNIRKYALLILSAAAMAALLIYTDSYKKSVTQGIIACGGVLIPALFPFFFLSSFIVYTDSLSPLTKRMGLFSKITGIPKDGIIAVFLCLIGGFPMGAKTADALYSKGKITQYQAERLCRCCVGAGPGFMVTFIGENILFSKQAGILLLVSNAVSVLLILLISYKKEPANNSPKEIINHMTIGEAIVYSSESAVKTTFSMCGFVVIFSVINNLLSKIPFYNGYIGAALEITCGMMNYGGAMPYEAVAFLIGFGGICVHFQIFGIAKEIKINKIYFIMTRVLQGAISALILHLLLIFFPVAEKTFGSLECKPSPALSNTIWGAFAIIILSLIFLISIKCKNKQEVNLCAE